MAKTAKRHRCIDCGSTTARWAGRCPSCGEWNTLVEEARLGPLVDAVDALDLSSMPVPLSSVDVSDAVAVPTGVGEFDRVLSGGLVPGSVTLLGGEPGIGKSTLLLQVLAARAAAGHRVLLVSAEESAHQVRLRAERLGPIPSGLLILSATDIGAVISAVVESAPELVVIDSVQAVSMGPSTLGERRPTGVPGSVTQVRECADQLIGLAKSRQVATVLVGHVTKDGSLAGPRALEHMVDTVLSFEGDRHHALRLLLAVKHRFGPTGELGLFEMGDQGLNRVDDPGRLLLGDRLTGVPGGVVLPALQGRRTLVVELQALVTPMGQAQAKRSVVGLDGGRLVMTLAVLDRHAGLRGPGRGCLRVGGRRDPGHRAGRRPGRGAGRGVGGDGQGPSCQRGRGRARSAWPVRSARSRTSPAVSRSRPGWDSTGWSSRPRPRTDRPASSWSGWTPWPRPWPASAACPATDRGPPEPGHAHRPHRRGRSGRFVSEVP